MSADDKTSEAARPYRGRIAPSPTGFLHLGHARTFWTAAERARSHHGVLIHRNEDLDPVRCRPEFAAAALEDLRWLGLNWQEGTGCGGPRGPYAQSARRHIYRASFERLRAAGAVYPCSCSRQDVLRALHAPHTGDEEPVYPGTCRPGRDFGTRAAPSPLFPVPCSLSPTPSPCHCWRFRVPDGEVIRFDDGRMGPQSFTAGRDFGDFVVWTREDQPSYQVAVVTDDALMGVTEVVRGADLILSTARQLLLYLALGWTPPAFYHTALVTDSTGARLAKRNHALSLRQLRLRGTAPEEVHKMWEESILLNPATKPPGG